MEARSPRTTISPIRTRMRTSLESDVRREGSRGSQPAVMDSPPDDDASVATRMAQE